MADKVQDSQTFLYLTDGEAYRMSKLNESFKKLSFEDRIRYLYDVFDEKDVLFTSSFGTRSILLIDLVSKIRPSQKIHFINTTYHFEETIKYKERLADMYGVDIIDVVPHAGQNALTRNESWWEMHPRLCCTINKIAPLEPIIQKHKVWITGLMAYQTTFRSRLNIFEQPGDIIKFHPLIDITKDSFERRLLWHGLKRHPLEKEGYGSVGCMHCTKKGKGRSGRWSRTEQTECGLHPKTYHFYKK